MHIIELYQLIEWINKEIREPQVVNKYQALFNIIQANAQSNRPQQPFEAQREDLINTISRVNLAKLSADQLKSLVKFNITPYVGQDGIDGIKDILYKNVIDIATCASSIQKIINEINLGLQKAENVQKGLENLVDLEEQEIENVLIRVTFTGNAAMSNIVDFKNWASTWHDIARGIAMAVNLAPEDVRIVGAKRGSIIVELAVAYGIAHVTSFIILKALQVADRVLGIRKKAVEIENLKLENKKLAKDIEAEAKKEKNSGLNNILNEVVKELKLKQDGEGDKITALDKSIKDLLDFVEKGGDVDFVMPESDTSGENEAENKGIRDKLKISFEEIKKLEMKKKLIEE